MKLFWMMLFYYSLLLCTNKIKYCDFMLSSSFVDQSFFFPFPTGMYGYHGKHSMDFLRITMAMPRLIAPAKRLLEQGFKFGPFPVQSYQSYEANIDFEIRCVSVIRILLNTLICLAEASLIQPVVYLNNQ